MESSLSLYPTRHLNSVYHDDLIHWLLLQSPSADSTAASVEVTERETTVPWTAHSLLDLIGLSGV